MSDVPNHVAVAAIDAIDTAYGHGDIPIGDVAGSAADTFEHGYTDAVVAKLPALDRRQRRRARRRRPLPQAADRSSRTTA